MPPNSISVSALKHPVEAVTIYQSSTAQITRNFRVDLIKGRNALKILEISDNIDTNSLRVCCPGKNAHVISTSFVSKVTDRRPREEGTGKTLEKLIRRRRDLEAELDVHETESCLLDNVVPHFLASDKSISFDSFMKVVERKRIAVQERNRINTEVASVNMEIEQLIMSHDGKFTSTIMAILISNIACREVVQLTYLMDNSVTWHPHYDLHASTISNGQPTSHAPLHYYANITQSTGEDWKNIVLTLSIANPRTERANSFTIPHIYPLDLFPRLSATFPIELPLPKRLKPTVSNHSQRYPEVPMPIVIPPPIPIEGPRMGISALVPESMNLYNGRPEFLSNVPQRPGRISNDEEQPARKRSSQRKNSCSLAYRMDQRVSLPGDGVAYKISVAVFDVQTTMAHVCVPGNPAALIEGHIKNTSEHELPAGPVNVFMDDNLVMKTSLSSKSVLKANDIFICTLGIDPSINLKMSSKTDFFTTQDEQNSKVKLVTAVETTIINTHPRASSDTLILVRNKVSLGNIGTNTEICGGSLLSAGVANAKVVDVLDVRVDFEYETAQSSEQKPKVHWISRTIRAGVEEGLYKWVCPSQAGSTIKLVDKWQVEARINGN